MCIRALLRRASRDHGMESSEPLRGIANEGVASRRGASGRSVTIMHRSYETWTRQQGKSASNGRPGELLMCGIVALASREPVRNLAGILDDMTDALRHRGPDDRGTFLDPRGRIGLGMRRLSILDLAGGHQPMASSGSDVQLVFNGEIYNHRELRAELLRAGRVFNTAHSDTEVVLQGYLEWGTELFRRLNGMFAIALWDRRNSQLVLARDRFGEKPLYVCALREGYLVSSELKAFYHHPEFKADLSPEGLLQYIAYDFVIAPHTLLQGVTQLPPGCWASITERTVGAPEVHRYWTPTFHISNRPFSATLHALDQALDRAVASRMVADVPVGLFLSGGLDSATIGFYMRRHSPHVESFSIGFEDPRYDEASAAAETAAALGTRHSVQRMSAPELLDAVGNIPDVLDEPMADQSILPTYLLSQFTSRHVKVALGGDGSDETLMGYKAFRALRLGWALDRLPPHTRKVVSGVARKQPFVFSWLHPSAPAFLERLQLDPTRRLLSHLGAFRGQPEQIVDPGFANYQLPAVGSLSCDEAHLVNLEPHQRAVLDYLRTYLCNDILVKIDRASMAASLEVRSPFLDPAVTELAFSLPLHQKMRWLTGKYALRRLMADRLPAGVLARPKKGFGVPMSQWLRGPLRPLLTDALAPGQLQGQGIFDSHGVSAMVRDHLTGGHDRAKQLWVLLQFQLWYQRWIDNQARIQAVASASRCAAGG